MLDKETRRFVVLASWRAIGRQWGEMGRRPAVFCEKPFSTILLFK